VQKNGTGKATSRVPLSYLHTKQIDSLYQANTTERSPKIRVSRDPSGKVLQTIIKENLGHLNIFSPRTNFDWRVSINNERKGSTSEIGG
jgi:polynucleotide 5'-triphosphatase